MLNRGKVLLTAVSVWLAVSSAFAVLTFDNSYYSSRNKERDVRKSTTLIILHTTEAPSRSALRKLSDLGECNFCINEAGRVFRIIDHRRESYHAGRSMWNGRSNVDEFSVGIEICGYHDKPLAAAQYTALAALLGGAMVCQQQFNLSFQYFTQLVLENLVVRDIVAGEIKSFLFGLVIGLISCYKGLAVTGGSAGVGEATTSSVVTSITVVIATDTFFNIAMVLIYE